MSDILEVTGTPDDRVQLPLRLAAALAPLIRRRRYRRGERSHLQLRGGGIIRREVTLLMPITRRRRRVRAHAVMLMVLVGIIGMALPFTLELAALRRLDATRAGIAAMLELPASALVAFFWLGQSLDLWQIIGCALVLAGITIVQLEKPEARYRPSSLSRNHSSAPSRAQRTTQPRSEHQEPAVGQRY